MKEKPIKKDDYEFEGYVRSKLNAIEKALTDIKAAISLHDVDMKLARDAIQKNISVVAVQTDGLERNMLAFSDLKIASNQILIDIKEGLQESSNTLKDSVIEFMKALAAGRLETSEAYKSKGTDRGTLLIILVAFLSVAAMFMGYTVSTGILSVNKNLEKVVNKQDETNESIVENRENADKRLSKPQKVIIDDLPLLVETTPKRK